MKSFKQFNEEKDKEAVFTFGRFNPPTVGHAKLIEKVAKTASGNNYFIYASHSVDKKKNPLEYKDKINIMRKMFPKHARNIVDSDAKTVFDIAVDLYNRGYTRLTMVVGSDRVKGFSDLLKKYDDVKAKHGYYSFPQGINIVSAGERDPDADDVSGMSASKMRAAASDGDFKSFQTGLPKGFSGGAELFNKVRSGMGLDKITDFREHVQLDKVSELRERYIAGDVFNVGDVAFHAESSRYTLIVARKPNYIVTAEGTKHWIDSLTETTKKTRYADIYKAIPEDIIEMYGNRAEDIRIQLAVKLSSEKYNDMTITEMTNRLRECVGNYK